MELCLENESSENRVRAWLEHLNETQGHIESEPDACEANRAVYSESTSTDQSSTCITDRKNTNHLKVFHRKFSLSGSDGDCRSSTTYRRSYSLEESNAIIRYIATNDVFSFIKGNLLWKKMEFDKVCHRSWQSMKNQFMKTIYPNLGTYSLNKDDLEKFMEYMKPSTPKKSISLKPGQRGWRRNGNYYRASEDKIIIRYVLREQRYLRVLGNSMWQAMEDEKVLPDRSWQSMRSRYLNFIMRDLEQYKLKESEVKKIMRIRRVDKSLLNKQKSPQKMSVSSRCSNASGDFIKKKKKQDMRRLAVYASVKLAANLKTSKTAEQNDKKKSCSNSKSPFREGNRFNSSRSSAESDKKKDSKNNLSNVKISENAIPNLVQNSVDSLKKSDTSLLNVNVPNVSDDIESVKLCNNRNIIHVEEEKENAKIQTEHSHKFNDKGGNEQNCAKEESKPDTVECNSGCNETLLPIGDNVCSNSEMGIDKEVNKEEGLSERMYTSNDINQLSKNDFSCSQVDVNPKKLTCVVRKERIVVGSGEICRPDINVQCENSIEERVPERLEICRPAAGVRCENSIEGTVAEKVDICEPENSAPYKNHPQPFDLDHLDNSTVSDCSFYSNTTVLCNDTNDVKPGNESATLQTSPRFEDDGNVSRSEGSYSCIAIKKCKKCSAHHKLSPSSN